MNPPQTLAIVGSGPSALYLLKHLLDRVAVFSPTLGEITVFEKNAQVGMGMPYNPQTTDLHNMANISSEELPELPVTFVDWLRSQTPAVLAELGLENVEINAEEVYNRLALGQYFKAQQQLLVAWLADAGIRVNLHADSEVTDIRDDAKGERVTVFTAEGGVYEFDRVVIATGHRWPEEDKPEAGYYACPWPISKLFPAEGEHHDFTIGTLGASLSAFDVISSLARRHGDFVGEGKKMKYHPHPGTEKFKIVMHSAKGLLPHLQFDQDQPMREIHRHVDRDGMMALMDKNGFLRIETYFDKVCRPVLSEAFQKDKMPEMVKRLQDPKFKLLDFVEEMGDQHEYADAFEGMRKEMKEAEKSVEEHRPIHWKEIIDDLMYTLNYYASFMPAEDHLTLQGKVMPFLMNVIAAMPLPSGNSILALHDIGKLEMVPGKVTEVKKQKSKGMTTVEVDDEDEITTHSYQMFIDCSGQRPLELKDYPFQSLAKAKKVREGRVPFLKAKDAAKVPEEKEDLVHEEDGQWLYYNGGIDIDNTYRVVGDDGQPNPRIYDIAFPHTSGHRPYSYGLQACSHTSEIVVKSWAKELGG